MKKKLVIVAILVLVMLMLVSCKIKESMMNDSNNQTTIEKNDTDSGKVIVEDEVTVDFGTEENKKIESDDKKENTTVKGNSEASDNSVNSGQTDNDVVPDDSDTSSVTKSNDSEGESEEPENPYDKDGDGYVDGWY